ncbi:MAG: hypothetical protein K8J31_04175 [Anaerolineae bacterium]|nr:hypothetical protein [Anaerolineae bacterium]
MKRWPIWIWIILLAVPLWAQDGLNLPTSLFVLTAEGRVDRYGLGAEGVRSMTPDTTFVVDFGVAPDGVWLAYRTEQELILRNDYADQSITIDGALAGVPSVRGRGDTVAWSPAGDAIAVTTLTGGRVYLNAESDPTAETPYTAVDLAEAPFVQVMWSPDGRYLAAESEGDIGWLYRRENQSIILTSAIPSSSGLAGYDDTKAIFAPQEGGLRLMDLSAANAQSVLLDETWTYALPYRRGDGTLLVFGRQADDPAVPEGFARLVGLPADEVRVDNLGDVAIDLTGLHWAPGGELMLAQIGSALSLVNPVDAQNFPLPLDNLVAYAWGPPPLTQAEGVTLPAPGFFLAADDGGTTQVWRLPRDGSAPEAVTSETDSIREFAVARGGSRIAYISGARLLVQDLNGSDPQPAADLSGTDRAFPSFSPDGQQIAYTDHGIWIVPASGGEASPIIADDETEGFARRFTRPVFAPNINALLIQVERETITVPAVLDPNTGEVLEIALEQHAEWLNDGRIMLYGLADGQRPGGLSIAGTASLTQPAQFLPDILSVQSAREVGANQLRLVLPEHLIGPQMLRVVAFDVTTGQLAPVHTGGFMVDAALSPDGTFAAGYVDQAGDEGRGPLTFRDLQTGQQVVLDRPAEGWHFVWAQP